MPAHAALRSEIAQLAQAWAIHMGKGDLRNVLWLYSPDAHIYSLNGRHIYGKKEIEEYLTAEFQSKQNLVIKFDEQYVRIFDDTAINSGDMTFSYKQNNKPYLIKAYYTFVYHKTIKGWFIEIEHLSPVDTTSQTQEKEVKKEDDEGGY